MPEKRRFRRLPVQPLPCRVHLEGMLLELSIGGAFIATDRPLPVGTEIDLDIPLSEGISVRASTRVEWSGDYYQGVGPEVVIGMGVSFQAITPEARLAVTRFLAEAHAHADEKPPIGADLPARIRLGRDWRAVRVVEIAERALFLATGEAPPEVGVEVDVLMRLPNASSPVDMRGRVERVTGERTRPGGSGVEFGVRIVLTEVASRAAELLRAFLDDARHD